MTEVLVQYDTLLRGRDDRSYAVRACGRARPDGLWEGWLEFIPRDGSEPIASGRETTQPNRDDLVYWARGLTDAYLDGALLRVQTHAEPRAAAPVEPATAGPAERHPPAVAPAAGRPEAVLDPFHVYREGDDVLRGQLQALSAAQLRNIILAHTLSGMSAAELGLRTKPELVALIMTAVEQAAG